MCGIAGIVNFYHKPNMVILEKMADIIAHRGPDGSGYFSEGSIALAHRRLAIIDRSDAGKQPMEYLNRYVITYNGEIYNYLELCKELKLHGYLFHSNTDTEVIMAAYDHWGKDCLSRFNGMFAFALYDRAKKEVFLARDRFGKKPLYYYIDPEKIFYFASEIKQFTVIDKWQAKLNSQRAYDFLNWGVTDHTDQTLFASVFQLRGGECLTLDLKQNHIPSNHDGWLKPTKWYSLEKTSTSITDKNPEHRFLELLQDSIRLRLRADVPIGSCLSGGLDSSSIVCIANKFFREQGSIENQKTFSFCTNVKEYDEKEYIDEVVRATQVDAYYTYPEPLDLFEQLGKLVWHQDEPFGSTSIFAQWSVFKLAREENVAVMLDGQGADEQLAGYHGFLAQRYASLCKKIQLIKLFQEIYAVKKIHGYSMYRSLQYLINGMLSGKVRQYARVLVGIETLIPSWLNMAQLGAQPMTPFAEIDRATTISSFSKTQLMSTHLPMLLRWEDRNSMAHSIEARVPFMDYRLVEYTYNLPDDFKLSKGITKRILRNSMSGILPEKIRMRMDKKGFVTPESIWFKKHADMFRSYLDVILKKHNDIFESQEIYRMFDAVLSGNEKFSHAIWRVICFGSWMEKFNVKR